MADTVFQAFDTNKDRLEVYDTQSVRRMHQPTLIATYGLPRSGKSTILRSLTPKAPIVSRDAIRLALHGKVYASEAEPFTRAIYKCMIAALFTAGHELVYADETHWSRAARDFVKAGPWQTKFLVVPTDSRTCLARAVETKQMWLLEVIRDMMKRVEPLGEDEEIAEYRYNAGPTGELIGIG